MADDSPAMPSPAALTWLALIQRLEHDLSQPSALPRDDEAWDELHSRVRKCASVVAHRLGLIDERDEITQEVLLRLQSIDTMRKIRLAGSPSGYLFVLVRNEAIDTLRARDRRARSSSRSSESPPAVPNEPPAELADLRSALRLLSTADRELLRLRFGSALSLTQIAARQGLSYAAVAMRLHRLMRRVRHGVKPQESDLNKGANPITDAE